MDTKAFGKFVRSTKSQDGIGKLVSSDGQISVIEYFDSPVSAERPRCSVLAPSVESVRLEPQTRVYFFDQKAGNWRAGRMSNHLSGVCLIDLPNRETIRLAESEVYTRWNHPIQDPCEHLAARVAETPFFHGARAALLASFVHQRAASAGLTAFLSAPVTLARHQVEVVRRVLQDPVQRYLLADEVGLGKTIEAGVIIRQFVLDYPDTHRVLVIAPETLAGQWKSEIRERCQLGERFKQRISIIALENLTNTPADQLQAGLVVVDEAHQAVKGWGQPPNSVLRKRFELLRSVTAPTTTPRLLLLSATPVRHNEDGFLALLHLLDPAVYNLSDVDSFREKVARRQELANLFYTFTEDTEGFFLEDMLDQLAELFPQDGRLQGLLSAVRAWLEPADPEEVAPRRNAIRAVRTHLSETYRLHRRLLRNRRSTAVESVLPGRRGLTPDAYRDDTAQQVEQALERWRAAAAAFVWGRERSEEGVALGRCFMLLLEAASSDLNSLIFCVSERLRPSQSSNTRFGRLTGDDRLEVLRSLPNFPEESVLLQDILRASKSSGEPNEDRIQSVSRSIHARLATGFRVVVFATSPAVADQIFTVVSRSRRAVTFRHRPEDDNWQGYRNTPNPAVLICDYRAEEGLNFQGGKTCMIHADLPFSPNILEQRIGRLDRFGADQPVISLTPLPEGCLYQEAWCECLSDAFGVFSRSIAALQYVVENEMSVLPGTLLTDGELSLRDLTARLSGEQGLLQKELKAIRAQDELDSIEVITSGDGPIDLTAGMNALDERSTELQACVDAWLTGRLNFARIDGSGADTRVVRYHYERIGDRRPTLVPPSEFVQWFGNAVDKNARVEALRPPLTWALSFFRETAFQKQVGLGRIGNPVLDCLHRYLHWDDRGTCFAFWRISPRRTATEVDLFFRFDFVVEASLKDTAQLRSDFPEISEVVLRRRGDAYFPPISRTIWVSEHLEPVEEATLDELERPFDKDSSVVGMRSVYDTNINHERWSLVRAHYPLTDWAQRCRAARIAAGEVLVRTVSLAQLTEKLAARLEAETLLVKEQGLSRIEALATSPREAAFAREDLLRELRVREALLSGVCAPELHLDAAGAVFLAGFPLV